MATNYNPKIITSGLVLCLDAANPRSYPGSGTIWKDLSGNGNDGTLVNGVGHNTDNQGAMLFDGVDDYIICSPLSHLSGNNPWTISIAINVDSSEIGSGRRGWIFWEGPNIQTNNQLISIAVNNGAIEVAHWANDTRFPDATIDFNSWNIFDITFDGVVEKVFKNGIEVGVKNTTLSITYGDLYFASRVGVEYLNCKYGNIRIYTRALSESEIKQNFEATRDRYGV